jgi:XRE family transcriptional regulator, stress-response regulator
VSEDATEFRPTDAAPHSSRPADATVLPFPSNRPLDRDAEPADAPRLRDVLGDVLRDERQRQERTLADVAREAAISLPYLSEVERGVKEVSSDLLDAIGTALELPLVDILERSAERLRTEAAPTERAVEMSVRSGAVRGQRTTRFQLAA